MGQHTNGIPYARSRGAVPAGAKPLAFVLTIVAVGAIAFWGSHLHGGSGDPGFQFQDSLALPPDVPAAISVPAPSLTPVTPKPSPRATSAPPSSAYTISYGFDGGASNLNAGLRGAPHLVERSANGGAIRTAKHGSGAAIKFPAVCARPGTDSCGRVILETTGDNTRLNPGSRRVQFGATLKMRADQTSDGENIVQKGFASGGSEYKLQVDGVKGLPSCAVVGTVNDRIYLAKASVPVDDGAWHTVACDLHGGALSITVDGVVRGRESVPTTLIVSNSDQLRIGGKGTSANNDQFDGELDDVWVTVGS